MTSLPTIKRKLADKCRLVKANSKTFGGTELEDGVK